MQTFADAFFLFVSRIGQYPHVPFVFRFQPAQLPEKFHAVFCKGGFRFETAQHLDIIAYERYVSCKMPAAVSPVIRKVEGLVASRRLGVGIFF